MKRKPPEKWLSIPADRLPIPLAGMYARQGRKPETVEFRAVVCRWDNTVRYAYRVKSDSGVVIVWNPAEGGRLNWEPKMEKRK